MPLQHLLPQVGGGRAGWIGRVALRPVVVTPVEGEEVRLLAGQPRGHPNLVVVDGEVDECAGAEAEQWLPLRVAVLLVLLDRGTPLLLEERLQLKRRHRQPVDEEHQVDGALVAAGRLRESFGAEAVDMEAAAVARAAEARGVEFGAVKAISDEVEFEFPATERFVDAEGRFSEGRFAVYAILRPWLWWRVIQLAKNSKQASRALCGYLGNLMSNPAVHTKVESGA